MRDRVFLPFLSALVFLGTPGLPKRKVQKIDPDKYDHHTDDSPFIVIVNPEIYRDRCIPISPNQTYQVDTMYNLMLMIVMK
jgi:hypothetical protein